MYLDEQNHLKGAIKITASTGWHKISSPVKICASLSICWILLYLCIRILSAKVLYITYFCLPWNQTTESGKMTKFKFNSQAKLLTKVQDTAAGIRWHFIFMKWKRNLVNRHPISEFTSLNIFASDHKNRILNESFFLHQKYLFQSHVVVSVQLGEKTQIVFITLKAPFRCHCLSVSMKTMFN